MQARPTLTQNLRHFKPTPNRLSALRLLLTTFGTITCRWLRVVDDEGNDSAQLGTNEHGDVVVAHGKDGW